MSAPASAGPPPARKAAVAFIFVTLLLDSLALGVSVPVLPKLVLQFEGGDSADAAAVFGVFGTAFSAMQFLFAPVLGALSDRFGRRPVILLALFGLGLDYVLMALAPSLGWLFVGRLLSGACAANFSTASAYIADVTPPEQRAKSFGMLGAAFGIGFVIGPAIGGVLGEIGLRAAVLGRGRPHARERGLRPVRAAGIASARAPLALRLAAGESDRRAAARRPLSRHCWASSRCSSCTASPTTCSRACGCCTRTIATTGTRAPSG